MRVINAKEHQREVTFWTLHPGVALKPMIEIAPGVHVIHTEKMKEIERTVNSRSSWEEWVAANTEWRSWLFSQFTLEELKLLSDMEAIS